jgi:hypothetical protein
MRVLLHSLYKCLCKRSRPCTGVLYFLRKVQAVRDELLEDGIMPEITLQDPQEQKFFNINSSEGPTQVLCNSNFSMIIFNAWYFVTTEHKPLQCNNTKCIHFCVLGICEFCTEVIVQILSFAYILQLLVEMWNEKIIVKIYMFCVCNPVWASYVTWNTQSVFLFFTYPNES